MHPSHRDVSCPFCVPSTGLNYHTGAAAEKKVPGCFCDAYCLVVETDPHPGTHMPSCLPERNPVRPNHTTSELRVRTSQAGFPARSELPEARPWVGFKARLPLSATSLFQTQSKCPSLVHRLASVKHVLVYFDARVGHVLMFRHTVFWPNHSKQLLVSRHVLYVVKTTRSSVA